MAKKTRRIVSVLLVLSWLSVPVDQVEAQFGKPIGKPKASVKLLSSVKSVVSGQSFDLAVRFDLVEGWHIYWKNPGDSGMAPRVTWKLPEGFVAEELQFPTPKRHVDVANLTTNIHEGQPALLVRVTAPQRIDSDSVTLAGRVQYLVCKDLCLMEQADVSLKLSVAQAGSESDADNEMLFKMARSALPKRKTPHLAITPRASVDKLAPGTKFDLLVSVDINKKFHIQSHAPLQPSLIRCDLFLERVPGVWYEDAVYPPPELRSDKFFGKLSEYSGKIVIRVPAEADEEFPKGPVRLAGVFTYQACNNKGQCAPPDAVTFSTTVGDAVNKGVAAAPQTPKLADAAPETADEDTSPTTYSANIWSPTLLEALAANKPAATSEDAAQLTEVLGEPIVLHPSFSKSYLLRKLDEAAGAQAADEGFSLQAFLEGLGLPGLLLGCFLYGLFINATPCVLPVLSIKVLSFVQQAHESRKRTLVLGLTFGGGVMLFFIILGFLAAVGKNVLQFPLAVIALGGVVTALALSMLGVFTLQVPKTATKLDAIIKTESLLSSFAKGALAPVLGFACTGPLLAGAFGWATQQPAHIAVFAFLFAGLGMASPYMLLGANPEWLSFLPRPGNWMITFERIMGFLLLAMVIWLLHPLVSHLGVEGLEWTLGFLVAIAMACWILGQIKITMPKAKRWQYRGGATAIVVVTGLLVYGWIFPLSEAQALQQEQLNAKKTVSTEWDKSIPWQPWSPQAVTNGLLEGRIVFVDFTAAYCTICKANKAVATNTPEVKARMQELNVLPLQGDFTSGDPRIFEILQKHERFGVPLNLIYSPKNTALGT